MVAKNHKTLYVLGCFGAPMTDSSKQRYTQNLAFNAKSDRRAKIMAANQNTFGFDCSGLIKGLLWGWGGDASKEYGGAKYQSGGVTDTNADSMIAVCSDVSTDFSNIQVGEVIWIKGHVGIYIGDGMAVECTHRWNDGVQITAVHNLSTKPGYNGRTWTKHGKLPWVDYSEKLYRVTVETVTKAQAEQLAKTYDNVTVEIMAEPAPEPEQPWEPAVEDTVYFQGGVQYSSEDAASGSQRPAGMAKITKTAPGTKHPYHLVRTGSTGPWGWVDANTFTKA